MSNIAKRFDAMLDALTASKLDWQYSTKLPWGENDVARCEHIYSVRVYRYNCGHSCRHVVQFKR